MPKYRELVNALTHADATGDTEGAAIIASMIRNKEYEDESSGAESALQGLGQGMTAGLADEAGAGVRAALFDPLVSSVFGSEVGGVRGIKDYFMNFGQRYRDALNDQRGALETARREDPWTTGVAELGGGLLTGGAGAARAAAGQTFGRGLARAAGVGATYGGAAGYGTSEHDPLASLVMPGQAPESAGSASLGALVDAGQGVAAGALVGGAVPLAGKGLQQVGKFFSLPFTKKQRLNEAGRRVIADALTQDLEAGKIDLKQAQDILSSTPGMMAADLGDNLRAKASQLTQSGTSGGRKLEQALTERNLGQAERINPALAEALTGKSGPSRFWEVSKEALDNLRKKSAPLYEQAYARRVRITKEMHDLLHNTPTGRIGLKGAAGIAADLQRKPPPLGKAGTIGSSEMADYALRSMSDHVNNLYKNVGPEKAHAAKIARDKFRDLLFAQNDDLRAAREFWSGGKAEADALEQGLKIFSQDADAAAMEMREMTAGQLTNFKVGVLRAVERMIGGKPETANLSRDLLHKPRVKEALRTAFGSMDNFDKFVAKLRDEEEMFKTFYQSVGNPYAARKLAAAGEVPGQNAAGMAAYLLTQGAGGFAPAIAKRGAEGVVGSLFAPSVMRRAEAMSGQQAGLLMTRNLADIMRPQTLGGLLGTGVPQSSAFLGGGLASSTVPGLLGQQ